MRTPLLMVVGLAIAGCGYRVDNCDLPDESFTLDTDLDVRDVKQLVVENHVISATDLECEVVCESIYLDGHPRGGATSVGACKLTIDGDLTGEPTEIVGAVHCKGRGIPQFCVDA